MQHSTPAMLPGADPPSRSSPWKLPCWKNALQSNTVCSGRKTPTKFDVVLQCSAVCIGCTAGPQQLPGPVTTHSRLLQGSPGAWWVCGQDTSPTQQQSGCAVRDRMPQGVLHKQHGCPYGLAGSQHKHPSASLTSLLCGGCACVYPCTGRQEARARQGSAFPLCPQNTHLHMHTALPTHPVLGCPWVRSRSGIAGSKPNAAGPPSGGSLSAAARCKRRFRTRRRRQTKKPTAAATSAPPSAAGTATATTGGPGPAPLPLLLLALLCPPACNSAMQSSGGRTCRHWADTIWSHRRVAFLRRCSSKQTNKQASKQHEQSSLITPGDGCSGRRVKSYLCCQWLLGATGAEP